MKKIVFLVLFLIVYLWLAHVLWAGENCFTVAGGDAQERMQNMAECREANALERIAASMESHTYGEQKTENGC